MPTQILKTGIKEYNLLVEIYDDTGLTTGNTKPNDPEDPDYIPPFLDILSCPPDENADTVLNNIKVFVTNSSTQSIQIGPLVVRDATNDGPGLAYVNAIAVSLLPNTTISYTEQQQRDNRSVVSFQVKALSKNRPVQCLIKYKKFGEAQVTIATHDSLALNESIEDNDLDTPRTPGTDDTNELEIVFLDIPVADVENLPPIAVV